LSGTTWESWPLGPSTRTVFPSTATFTPWGTGIGFLPIRDMAGGSLPHVGEDFPAEMLPFALAVGHDAAGRGPDCGPNGPEDGRQLVVGRVHAAARPGYAGQSRDDLLAARPVLQIHAQRALLAVLDEAVVLDEPLLLQHLGDPHLELGRGD